MHKKIYSLATKNRRESNNAAMNAIFTIVDRLITCTLWKLKPRMKSGTTISIKLERTKGEISELITLVRNKRRPSVSKTPCKHPAAQFQSTADTISTLIGAKSFLTTDRFRSVQVRTKRKWKLEADLSLVWHDILTGTIHRERSGIRGSFVPFVHPSVV